MKNTIFGQLYKILILASSISILTACGASDVLDLADDIDNGGGNVETFGSVTVSGNDTGTIGTSFEPITERLSEPVVANVLAVTFGAGEVNIIAQTGIVQGLAIIFSENGTPLSIAYVVDITTNDIDYNYINECDASLCSGININTATGVITLSNVVIFVNVGVDTNLASDSVTLNGSVTYTVL